MRWQHLDRMSFHPCCWIQVPLQPAELFLFYHMEQEGDRAEKTVSVAAVQSIYQFPWAILS